MSLISSIDLCPSMPIDLELTPKRKHAASERCRAPVVNPDVQPAQAVRMVKADMDDAPGADMARWTGCRCRRLDAIGVRGRPGSRRTGGHRDRRHAAPSTRSRRSCGRASRRLERAGRRRTRCGSSSGSRRCCGRSTPPSPAAAVAVRARMRPMKNASATTVANRSQARLERIASQRGDKSKRRAREPCKGRSLAVETLTARPLIAPRTIVRSSATASGFGS